MTHDVNRLLSYIHEVDQSRTSEHHELSESIRAIREELLDIHGLLIDREERVVEVPVVVPAPVPAPAPAHTPVPILIPVSQPPTIIFQPQAPEPAPVVVRDAPPPVPEKDHRDAAVSARSEVSEVSEPRIPTRPPSVVARPPSIAAPPSSVGSISLSASPSISISASLPSIVAVSMITPSPSASLLSVHPTPPVSVIQSPPILVRSPEPIEEPIPEPTPPAPSPAPSPSLSPSPVSSAPSAIRSRSRPPSVQSLHDVPPVQQPRGASPPARVRPQLIPIPLTPPPLRRRLSSPDSLSEVESYLSSHHSDDLSLLESEPYPLTPRAASPSWPSSSTSSSSPLSSPSSSSVSFRDEPRRPVSRSVSSESDVVYSPQEPARVTQPSPVPSSVSSGTIRGPPPVNFSHLRELLERLGHQIITLEDGQSHTHQVLEDLRNRSTTVIQERDTETTEKLRRIEEMLQRLLSQQQSVPVPVAVPVPVPVPVSVPAPTPPETIVPIPMPVPDLAVPSPPSDEALQIPAPLPILAPVPIPPPSDSVISSIPLPIPPPLFEIIAEPVPAPQPASAPPSVSSQSTQTTETVERVPELVAPPPPHLVQAIPRDDTSETTISSSSGASSLRRRIARFRDELERGREHPPLHMPTPVRIGVSFDEQLADLLAVPTPPAQAAVQPPPPIVPLVYRPGPRAPRPRSVSPTVDTLTSPRRPHTAPVEPILIDRPIRQGPRTRPPRAAVPPTGPEPGIGFPQPIVPVVHGEGVRSPPRSDTGPDIDFLDEVLRRRRGDRPERGQRPGRTEVSLLMNEEEGFT